MSGCWRVINFSGSMRRSERAFARLGSSHAGLLAWRQCGSRTLISSIVFVCQGLIVHDRLYQRRLAADACDRYNPPQSIEKTCIVRPSGMAIERTLSIIKPDATGRNVTGIINATIEKAGLRIVAQK